MIIPRHVLGGTGYAAPSDQLTKAIIGVGGMGIGHIPYEGTRVLAVCDVDRNHLKAALDKAGKDAKGYADYREVLARKDIDVVHIATPPHWHGLMAVEAARAGKDIWCEKPMTRTIGEGIRVIDEVNKYGRMFRLNTWFRFKDTFYGLGTDVRPLKKIVQSRALGWPLKFTVSGVTGYDWKFYWSGRTDLVPTPVPAELDYDLWLGPAPYKPYNPERVHAKFRGYWDYDGGGLGDMGQHYLDPVQYLLDKDDTSPIRVDVDAPQQHYDAAGSWRRIEYTYADGCKIILDGENRDTEAAYIEGPLRQDLSRFQVRYSQPAQAAGNAPRSGTADRDLLRLRAQPQEIRLERNERPSVLHVDQPGCDRAAPRAHFALRSGGTALPGRRGCQQSDPSTHACSLDPVTGKGINMMNKTGMRFICATLLLMLLCTAPNGVSQDRRTLATRIADILAQFPAIRRSTARPACR